MTAITSPIGAEMLDEPGGPDWLVQTALREIGLANALLGGRAAAAWGLDRLLDQLHPVPDRPLTLLDLGAGCGDIARHLVRRAARRGVRILPVALDRHRVAGRLCRAGGLSSVVADVWDLPVATRSVDLVVASQLLHHFSRPAAGGLVRMFDRIARLGVVVADLRRAWIAQAGIWAASMALGFHGVTRQDGITSVRRGFTPAELDALLGSAGIRCRVTRRPGYRVVAAWRASHAHG